MGEWDFIGKFFETLQSQSPMLGRLWLLLMLVFRILILGTVASDLFEDEQEEFTCNTGQPGCKQVCYDEMFPISQYRFWVFHIVLIATPSLIFIMYATHHHNKKTQMPKSKKKRCQELREDQHVRRLYIVNVVFRIMAEVGFLVGQWWLYGFRVQEVYECSRKPCPHTVDCYSSRPAEKTVFLCFYFAVGVLSGLTSLVELFYSSGKWFVRKPVRYDPEQRYGLEQCSCENIYNAKQEEGDEKPMMKKMPSDSGSSTAKFKELSLKGSKKVKRGSYRCPRYVKSRIFSV